MKYAVIGHEQTLNALGLWTRGYQFALGQKLLDSNRRNPSAYADYFKRVRENGGFILVDNGAAEEEDEPISFSALLLGANYIRADEVILPDVLKDSQQTLRRTCDTLVLSNVPPKRRMIVPQGDTWPEWWDCLKDMRMFMGDDFASIGLPKHLERLPGGRAHAVKCLINGGLLRRHHVHMLGVWQDAEKEISQLTGLEREAVRGIDSGLPIACAQWGYDLRSKVSLAWTPVPPEWLSVALDNVSKMDAIVCQ